MTSLHHSVPSGAEQQKYKQKRNVKKRAFVSSPLQNNESSISSLILRGKNHFRQLHGILFFFSLKLFLLFISSLHELTISQHSLLHASFIIYRQREIKERFAYIPGAEETSHHSNIIYFAILAAAEGLREEGGN